MLVAAPGHGSLPSDPATPGSVPSPGASLICFGGPGIIAPGLACPKADSERVWREGGGRLSGLGNSEATGLGMGALDGLKGFLPIRRNKKSGAARPSELPRKALPSRGGLDGRVRALAKACPLLLLPVSQHGAVLLTWRRAGLCCCCSVGGRAASQCIGKAMPRSPARSRLLGVMYCGLGGLQEGHSSRPSVLLGGGSSSSSFRAAPP